MGHEYLELKNTPAAIAAYRHAVGTSDQGWGKIERERDCMYICG